MVLLIKVIQATSNMALRISDFIKSENLVGVSWCCYRRDTGLVMLVAVYLYLICRHLQLYLSRPYLHPFRDPNQMRDMFSHTPLSLLTFDIVLSCESLRSPAGCHLPHCPPWLRTEDTPTSTSPVTCSHTQTGQFGCFKSPEIHLITFTSILQDKDFKDFLRKKS